jgi:predicted lipoprotein with Yx(FWY)xxD motif
MRPLNRMLTLPALVAGVALIAAACSSSAATPGSTVLGATSVPTTAPVATMAPSQAAAALTIGVTADATLGSYLTGANGMTLYIFTVDKADTSNCTGGCAAAWPPLTVAAGTAVAPPMGSTSTFSLITRADGTMQVAYNHMPLYYYSKDTAAGQTTGQGFGGKWWVAPLSGMAPAAPAAPATKAPGATKTMPPSGY